MRGKKEKSHYERQKEGKRRRKLFKSGLNTEEHKYRVKWSEFSKTKKKILKSALKKDSLKILGLRPKSLWRSKSSQSLWKPTNKAHTHVKVISRLVAGRRQTSNITEMAGYFSITYAWGMFASVLVIRSYIIRTFLNWSPTHGRWWNNTFHWVNIGLKCPSFHCHFYLLDTHFCKCKRKMFIKKSCASKKQLHHQIIYPKSNPA